MTNLDITGRIRLLGENGRIIFGTNSHEAYFGDYGGLDINHLHFLDGQYCSAHLSSRYIHLDWQYNGTTSIGGRTDKFFIGYGNDESASPELSAYYTHSLTDSTSETLYIPFADGFSRMYLEQGSHTDSPENALYFVME